MRSLILNSAELCADWAAQLLKARPGSPSGRDFLITIPTEKEYQKFLGSRGSLWHGRETGHNNCYRGTVGRPATTILSRAASTTDEHHRCRCRLVGSALCLARPVADRQGPHDPWGHATRRDSRHTRVRIGGRTHALQRLGKRGAAAVECPRSVPTHDGPRGSSTNRGTRAKTTGNTRRT